MTHPATSKIANILCLALLVLCCTGPLRSQSQPKATASCEGEAEGNCHLGSALTLRFPQPNTDITPDNAQKLELMLNGQSMSGLTARKPLQTEKDKDGKDQGVLTFDLNIQSSNKDKWKSVLAAGRNQTLDV